MPYYRIRVIVDASREEAITFAHTPNLAMEALLGREEHPVELAMVHEVSFNEAGPYFKEVTGLVDHMWARSSYEQTMLFFSKEKIPLENANVTWSEGERSVGTSKTNFKVAVRFGNEVSTLESVIYRLMNDERGDDIPILMEAFGCDYEEASKAVFSGDSKAAITMLLQASQPDDFSLQKVGVEPSSESATSEATHSVQVHDESNKSGGGWTVDLVAKVLKSGGKLVDFNASYMKVYLLKPSFSESKEGWNRLIQEGSPQYGSPSLVPMDVAKDALIQFCGADIQSSKPERQRS